MHFSHTIHIDAPVEHVWAATVDVERWPQFSPQFRSITRLDDGDFRVGSHTRIGLKGLTSSVWIVTSYEDGRSFTWEADIMPGAHIVAGHVVEPDASGANVTLSLDSSGPTSMLLTPLMAVIFPRNVRGEAAGMKAYVESGKP